jgi:hypothetical protein
VKLNQTSLKQGLVVHTYLLYTHPLSLSISELLVLELSHTSTWGTAFNVKVCQAIFGPGHSLVMEHHIYRFSTQNKILQLNACKKNARRRRGISPFLQVLMRAFGRSTSAVAGIVSNVLIKLISYITRLLAISMALAFQPKLMMVRSCTYLMT